MSPTATSFLVQAKGTIKKQMKTRVKTAAQAAILMQGTQDDLDKVEKFQHDALGTVGLKVVAPPVSEDWACPPCHFLKQASHENARGYQTPSYARSSCIHASN